MWRLMIVTTLGMALLVPVVALLLAGDVNERNDFQLGMLASAGMLCLLHVSAFGISSAMKRALRGEQHAG